MIRRILGFALAVLVASCELAPAQTYTPNKNLAQPTVGGNSNAWGTLLNNNATLLDSALGGTASVSVAGNSNVTATTTQAENLVQRLTGALTGNIDYILPAVGGLYVVDNQTSGSYTVTVITSAGGSSGTTVPQGSALLVYSDGTNIYPATRSRSNALTAPSATISGTLTFGALTSASGNLTTNGVVQGGTVNSLGGYGLSEATVTAAGSTQGTATALTKTLNMVSGSGGVVLSSAYAFEPVIIQNTTNASIDVYPGSGGTITYNGTWTPTNGPIGLAGYTTAICFGVGSTSFACR